MKIFKNNRKEADAVVAFFTPKTSGLENVEMGSAKMEANSESNWAAHQGDEYSYVVTGALTCYAREDGQEKSYQVKAGDAICTPAGQEHKSVNTSSEDCFVIWFEVTK